MQNNRHELQLEAIKAWAVDRRGVVVAVTGLGKSFIGVKIAATQLESGKIKSAAVIVPTINLVEQWQDEFKKWGHSTDGVDFYCIQSAYKLVKSYDLLIVDECHTSLSPKYREVYKWNFTQYLGLTATLPEDAEYRTFLASIAPIVFNKGFKDIEDQKVIAKYQVFNLPVTLTRADRAKYNSFNKLFAEAQMQIGIMKKNNPDLKDLSIFDIAQEYSTRTEPEFAMLIKYSKQFWSAMTMRKWVCYNSQKKIETVKQITSLIPDRKWIVFNKSIKMAELIARELGNKAVVYHSKMKSDEREIVLNNFKNNVFQYLVAVDALNAGLDVPDVDAAICVSGTSTELVAIQQLGRTARYKENKFAIFINLFSSDTVEERWVKKKNTNLKNIWLTNTQNLIKWLDTLSKPTSILVESTYQETTEST